MRFWYLILLLFTGILFQTSCKLGSEASSGGKSAGVSKKASGLERLSAMMSGSYSSQAQSLEDTSFYDIRLEMARIWPERTDGHWLYVEQAVSTYLDRPYRQRVYQLVEEPDGRYRSIVYTLNDPIPLIGAWKKPSLFDQIGQERLKLREGCDIVMSYDAEKDQYSGSTADKTCPSNLRDARWASAEVELNREVMFTWDKGLNDEGEQLWGSEKGPYRFEKLSESGKAPKR